MWLERQVAKGEIDGDELYADGKVDADVLTEALAGLAASKPGWLIGAAATNGKPAGDADAGKGASRGGATSVKSELDAIRQHKS